MTLRLKGSYSVSAAENPTRLSPFKPITCNVIFLDDKSEIFKLDKNARGQVLIDFVFDFLELLERDFFGLQYTDFTCNPGTLLRWLEPAKTLKKQLKGAAMHTLWLRVKFYVPDPLWLQEEFTRYLVYLQVRKDVLNGILLAPTPLLAKMAGLCLQSELGDYSVEDCKPGYVSRIRLVPNQTTEFEAEAIEAHKSFRTYVPASAELEYLNIARRLELYGIHPQEVTDRNRTKLSLGVSSQGLSVFRGMRRLFLYAWDTVERIAFSGKTFSVNFKQSPHPASLSIVDTTSEAPKTNHKSGKQGLSSTFFFETAKHAKVFWRFAVTCHTFFRVKQSPSPDNAFFAFNGGFRSTALSVPTRLSSSVSSPSGFSRFFLLRGTRSRRSLSVGTASTGLERTMSTLMELRRRSKSIEREFSRGVSRRFSRRRSFAAPARTQSVSLLNAYESRDSLGVQSVLLPSEDSGMVPKSSYTDLETTSTPDKEGNGGVHISSPETKSALLAVDRIDRTFPRKFRSSASSFSKTSPKLKIEDGDVGDTPLLVGALNESHSEQNFRKRQDSVSKTPSNFRDYVLPRPTVAFTNRSGDHMEKEERQNSRTKMSLVSGLSVEKPVSVRRSLESNDSTSVVRRQNPSKITSKPANTGGGSSGGGLSKDTLSVSPNASTESLIKVRLWPNADGHYGFNVEGGADHNQPITVNRIGENMPAETASPHLHLGDRIIRINDRDISNDTLEQVTSAVRKAAQSSTGLLELIVRPIANYPEEYRVTGTGDVPPRPPRTSPTMETHNSTRDASTATTWLSPASPISQRLDTPSFDHNHQSYQMQQPQNSQCPKLQHQASSPSVRPKPRSWNYASARARSTSTTGSGKTSNSDTESLATSIRNIQNGLADGSLVRQFDELGVGNSEATMLDAKQNNNMKKNRYRDIFPYDHTRVKIQGIDSDYINASFVRTTIPKSGLRVYIASQGPLKTTCADFWQMCWEQRSELIVMLTSLKEKNRETCCQYWPNVNQTSDFPLNNHNSPDVRSSSTSSSSLRKCSQLRICNTKEEKVGHVMYREFRVRRITMVSKGVNDAAEFCNTPTSPIANDEEVRRIVQLQYISWPDHGVPRDCADLIAFVERMRSLRDRGKSNPVIVHCSAGIGRTGVVILLDTAMDMICGHSPVRPIEIVRQMRKDRDMLIQTPAQFQFVCEAIVRYYQDTLVRRPLLSKGRGTTPTDKQS